jgi:hypothetical protein
METRGSMIEIVIILWHAVNGLNSADDCPQVPEASLSGGISRSAASPRSNGEACICIILPWHQRRWFRHQILRFRSLIYTFHALVSALLTSGQKRTNGNQRKSVVFRRKSTLPRHTHTHRITVISFPKRSNRLISEFKNVFFESW